MRKVQLKEYKAPHLQRIYNQGVRDGANVAAHGLQDYLDERIASLREVSGIGEKTLEKVIEHFTSGIRKQ